MNAVLASRSDKIRSALTWFEDSNIISINVGTQSDSIALSGAVEDKVSVSSVSNESVSLWVRGKAIRVHEPKTGCAISLLIAELAALSTGYDTGRDMSIAECEVVGTDPDLVIIVGRDEDSLAGILNITNINDLWGGRKNHSPQLCVQIVEHDRVSTLYEKETITSTGINALSKSMGKLVGNTSIGEAQDVTVDVKVNKEDTHGSVRRHKQLVPAIENLDIIRENAMSLGDDGLNGSTARLDVQQLGCATVGNEETTLAVNSDSGSRN
jgi:hypothetical protein